MIIDIWSTWNFVSMEDIKRKYNLMVDLSKLISNKKILSEVLILSYKKVLIYIYI